MLARIFIAVLLILTAISTYTQTHHTKIYSQVLGSNRLSPF